MECLHPTPGWEKRRRLLPNMLDVSLFFSFSFFILKNCSGLIATAVFRQVRALPFFDVKNVIQLCICVVVCVLKRTLLIGLLL